MRLSSSSVPSQLYFWQPFMQVHVHRTWRWMRRMVSCSSRNACILEHLILWVSLYSTTRTLFIRRILGPRLMRVHVQAAKLREWVINLRYGTMHVHLSALWYLRWQILFQHCDLCLWDQTRTLPWRFLLAHWFKRLRVVQVQYHRLPKWAEVFWLW